eukprot:15485155-Alexandrium_andersonii.AAC.1
MHGRVHACALVNGWLSPLRACHPTRLCARLPASVRVHAVCMCTDVSTDAWPGAHVSGREGAWVGAWVDGNNRG